MFFFVAEQPHSGLGHLTVEVPIRHRHTY